MKLKKGLETNTKLLQFYNPGFSVETNGNLFSLGIKLFNSEDKDSLEIEFNNNVSP